MFLVEQLIPQHSREEAFPVCVCSPNVLWFFGRYFSTTFYILHLLQTKRRASTGTFPVRILLKRRFSKLRKCLFFEKKLFFQKQPIFCQFGTLSENLPKKDIFTRRHSQKAPFYRNFTTFGDFEKSLSFSQLITFFSFKIFFRKLWDILLWEKTFKWTEVFASIL